MKRARLLAGSVVALCVASLAPGHAAERLNGLLACRGLTDDAARLACFDRESASLDVNGAPAAVLPTPSTPALDPKRQFGLPERTIVKKEVASGARAADAQMIEAHIVQLSKTSNGRALFTLDNDQVWRQLVADVEFLGRTGDSVTISRGLFGSYWLQTPEGRGCKVTRVH